MTPPRLLALLALSIALAACGPDPRERLAEARAAVEEQGPEAALALALELADDAPMDEGFRVDLSDFLVELQQPKRAIELLEALPEPSPKGRDALAFALFTGRRMEEGDRILRELVREGKDTARTHLLMGMRLRFENKLDKLEEAEKEIREATKRDPDDPRAWSWLGHVLMSLDRPEEAEEVLRKAIARFPESPAVKKSMADLLMATKPRDPAALGRVVELLGFVVRKRPLDRTAVGTLAVAHMRLEQYPEAEVVLSKAVERWPGDPLLWSDLGLTRLKRGSFPEALAALERAFELAPDQLAILLNLANAYLAWADIAPDRAAAARRAREIFQIGLEKHPENPDLLVGVARSMVKEDPAGNLDHVLPIYERVLEKYPGNFPANLNLALLLYDRWKAPGDTREDDGRRAWEHFRRAAAAVPPSEWEVHAAQVFGELDERFGR